MKKGLFRKVLVFVTIMLFISTGIFPSIVGTIIVKKSIKLVFIGNTLYVGGSGPNNYTSIQDAINNSISGDTVYVYNDSSPYYEHINVNKSINLVGVDKDTTIIDGSYNGDVVKVTVDKVTIIGFTIKNSGEEFYSDAGIDIYTNDNTITGNIISNNKWSGIYLYGNIGSSNNNTITDNIISNNDYGIWLSTSSNNTISINNISSNNNYGIYFYLEGSSRNTIKCNNISKNGWMGLSLWCSNSNIINGNNISKNKYDGIELEESNSNIITDNNIRSNKENGIMLKDSNSNIITDNNIRSNNNYGVYLLGSSNNNISSNIIIFNNDKGVSISHWDIFFGPTILSQYNIITHNTISNNNNGIWIWGNRNTISGNYISSNNKYGVYLVSSILNIITRNTISNNSLGITLDDSLINFILRNNFIGNKRHASFIKGKNIWMLNYWDRPRLLPKLIFGRIQRPLLRPQRYIGRIWKIPLIPWFNIDWRPVLLPIKI